MPPSLKQFRRGDVRPEVWLSTLARWVDREVDARCDPSTVSLSALRRMDTDPIVYLGEWAITGLVRKPDLYHVTHPLGDKKLIAENEEWLWPLMQRGLLGMIARSFLYGSVPYVFDWGRGNLVIRVPSKSGKPRSKTLPGHYHYLRAHELFPSEVDVLVDPSNELLGLRWQRTGEVFDSRRARVSVWDRQFGEWFGQGARRRSWSYYAKGWIFELLEARYLEKSVHSPLIVHAPGDDVKPAGGEEEDVGEFVAEQLLKLRGGGVMVLPDDRHEGGERMYSVSPLELPERSEVFDRALNRFDNKKLAAYLVPPALGAALDGEVGGGASRVLKDMFATFAEALVQFVAIELTAIVEVVHAQNYDPEKVLPPEVGANEIPDKVQKLYVEVLRLVGEAAQLGQRVDVDACLDHLGVPRRADLPEPEPTAEPGPGQPGRPRDLTGAREQRREDARTDEGAEDTGGKRQDREERE